MPKPRRALPERNSSHVVPIAVAVIGALAVLLSAAVSNWDKLFSSKQQPAATAASQSVSGQPGLTASAPPAIVQAGKQSTSGDQSPNVTGRDISISFGSTGGRHVPTSTQRSALEGDWTTGVFDEGGDRQQLYFNFKALPDGKVLGSVQPLDPDTGRKIFSPYGIKDGNLNGSSMTVSYNDGTKGRDAAGEATVPIDMMLYGEIVGDKIILQYVRPGMAPLEIVASRAAASGSPK